MLFFATLPCLTRPCSTRLLTRRPSEEQCILASVLLPQMGLQPQGLLAWVLGGGGSGTHALALATNLAGAVDPSAKASVWKHPWRSWP